MHDPGAKRKHFLVAKRPGGPAEATTERAFALLRNQVPEARIRNLSPYCPVRAHFPAFTYIANDLGALDKSAIIYWSQQRRLVLLRTTFQPVQCSDAGRKNKICLTLSPPTTAGPDSFINIENFGL